MSEWITTEQAALYEETSCQTIRRWINESRFETQTEIKGGIKRHYIKVDSLSIKAQKKYLQDTVVTSSAKPSKNERPKVDTQDKDVLGQLVRRFKDKGNKLLEELVDRSQIAQEVLRIRASSETNKTELINQLAADAGVSPATIRRWADSYVQYGQDGLIHRNILHSLFTPKEYRSFDALAQDYLRIQYLSDRQFSIEHCYNRTTKLAVEKDWAVGSYQTACRIIHDIPEEDIIFFRQGEEAWKNACMPRALRKDPEFNNEIWEGDHTRMNFFIEHEGKPIRLWLTIWVDARSRCTVGWCISTQANGETIGLSLRNAILPKKNSPIYGIPKYVLIDNGQDYISKRIMGERNPNFAQELQSPHLMGLFGRLGIMARNCAVRNGAGKGRVERKFRDITAKFYRDNPGWCGANTEERPAGLKEYKLCEEEKLSKFDQVVEDFSKFIDELNNAFHSEIGMTPLEKYLEGKRYREDVPSPRLLDLWLLPGDARVVNNVGIRFMNRVYDNIKALSGYTKEKISIFYDPNDLSKIYAFDLNGEFIDELPLKEKRPYITEEEDMYKHVGQQKGRRTMVTERRKEMQERLEEVGVQTKKRKHKTGTGENDGNPKVVNLSKDEKAAKQVEAARRKTPASETNIKTGQPGIHDRYVRDKSDSILKKLNLG